MQMVTHQGEPADGVRVVAHGRIVAFMRASPWPRVLRFVDLGERFGDETILAHLGPNIYRPEYLYTRRAATAGRRTRRRASSRR